MTTTATDTKTETIPELSPGDLAVQLTDTATRLSGLIEGEVELLEHYQVAEIEALQAEKQELSQVYQGLMAQLSDRPEAVAEMGAQLRDGLRDAAERLVKATEANAIALRAGIEANNRLMTNIAQAVQEQEPRSAQYHADGRAATGEEDPRPVSVSLDEVL